MKKTTIIEFIVVLYTILFIYTGVNKLMDYSVFKEQLAESPVLAPVSPFIAAVLPWMEFMLVLMLINAKWRLGGLFASLALMTVFTIYIIVLLSFSDKLPCSCGGVLTQLSWPQHILFNSVFILLATWGIVLEKRTKRENLNTSIAH